MEPSFWEARWRKNHIGFHLPEVNPLLATYLHTLHLHAGDTVIVPMCGKSLDMLHLREQGLQVLGVELSEIAIQAFFTENNLPFVKSQFGQFLKYESEGITILCGNIFNLQQHHIADAVASFDRAALVAFPPEMRRRYVEHLTRITPNKFRTLLVTFEYPQQEMSGPPFSVWENEVRELFNEWERIELLHEADILQENSQFRERGITAMHDKVFFIQKGIVRP